MVCSRTYAVKYVAQTYGYRGEVNTEWVHPVVPGQNRVLDGDMTRDTLTEAGLALPLHLRIL